MTSHFIMEFGGAGIMDVMTLIGASLK